MGEAATDAAGPPRGRGLGRAGRPGTVAAGRRLLRRAEAVAYWLAVAPLVARLPAGLAYRVACWRGDRVSRYRAGRRSAIVGNLRWVLGEQLGQEEAERLARDFFRMVSCEVIDVMRLRGQARSLGRLVEIRGREHLDAALAGGRGAILCSAHFGSYNSAFSLLHASGFPLTTIGRWHYNYTPGMSPAERRFWAFVYARRLLRHRQRPMIEPWPGQVQVAVQAAVALRANEVVTICGDAAPLDADLARTVEVAFLGRQARLLPGVVTLARLTGAPVLMVSMHRLADYRHQVLEISPPVPVQGETAMAFGRCVAAMDAAIRTSPAQWFYWPGTDDLRRTFRTTSLGLLPAAPPAGTAAVSPHPAVDEPAALLEDRPQRRITRPATAHGNGSGAPEGTVLRPCPPCAHRQQ
jgi:lauroyl/myristoyl acyltransferase